ncbi:MAG: Nramp family divalent metal transporter [Phormidesmis sp.]
MSHQNQASFEEGKDYSLGQKESPAEEEQSVESTQQVPPAPAGWSRLKWLGPGFLWMLSSAGSGELLFTPRIASLYGYTLLWALLLAVALKWFINREVGRFAVCTGATMLEGFKELPGPKNWAVWLILVPQLFVAVSTVAGMSGAAATALILLTGGTVQMWMIIIVLVTVSIVLLGQYDKIDKAASYLAILLTVAVLVTAISVLPNLSNLAAGLVPQVPPDVNYTEILPWLGFMLAGAAGLMWYSYWVDARGYGASQIQGKRGEASQNQPIRPKLLDQESRDRLKSWVSVMSFSNTLAVLGSMTIALAFFILGGELLRPEGLVPAESEIANTLGRLLGDIWGTWGYWFMIIAVFVTFCSTTLSVEDGFSRMFADGTNILLRGFGLRGNWIREKYLRRFFLVVLLAALPIGVYLAFGKPVGLLQTAGAIEAAHIPVVTGLTLYLNHRFLPEELKPSKFTFFATATAGVFFAGFALVYLYQTFFAASGS